MELSQETLDSIYREEWGRIVATLIRLLGSFELAEEATQEAFTAALERWPREGLPANPRAWLIATARHKAIDALRRKTRWEDARDPEIVLAELEQMPTLEDEEDVLEDDRLRLIFTCCHPALATEAQVALTLRTLCGLTTEQIARGFLVPTPTMAQRLVRAQQKIRDAGIPYRTPPRAELAERLAAVLLVVYLVFNEGYNAAGEGRELSDEAVRLGRLLRELLPREAEVKGLLALMLLHDARRAARRSSDGEWILLEEQNRRLWDPAKIREGLALAESALRSAPGPYSVQAAIAGVHAQAASAGQTDWAQIVALYDVLVRLQPSPVIELNRAVAVAMASGCEAGLQLIDELEGRGELRGYYLLPAARADLLRRLGRWDAAAQAYMD
ncbi:MAG TPA: RNA polymerase sigma factor, partial [Terracidiphilus sp.]|nr:RNA polymerase sigma factor [Terracidiphilus sp.]